MDWDPEKIDDAVLGLLFLTLHDGNRAWKNFDWDILNRLHAKGLIENPKNKNKSVALTPEGLELAQQSANEHFGAKDGQTWKALNTRQL